LVKAIRQIHHGESSLHPAIARKVLQEISQPADRPPTPNPLTEREAEVLRLVAQGLSNQDIARKLNISDPTVRTHVSNILGRLQLATRIQAALCALREGMVSLDTDAGRDPEGDASGEGH
jgi:two-component system, NarL family, response regulator LiaR